MDCILITAPDRLARNYVHQMILLEEWTRFGCQVEFLDRPMSQDPHDQLLLQIRSAGLAGANAQKITVLPAPYGLRNSRLSCIA